MTITVSCAADGIIQRPVLVSPPGDVHKYERGHLIVISGPSLRTGASRLAATAGLLVGAGLVTIVGDTAALTEHAAHVTAVMLRVRGGALDITAMRASAAIIGPAAGMSSTVAADALTLVRAQLPLVIDADGLTVFASDRAVLFAALHRDVVLTPHHGEFVRLFGDIAPGSPVAAARAAAQLSGAIVALKGPQTVIAAPDGRYAINHHAASWLATAGSGDVLSGMIGGLLATGMPAFDAACAAVWLHGDIGRRGGPGLTADTMLGIIPAALQGIWRQ